MVEVSTSVLNLMEVEENQVPKILYDIEMARPDYFHIDVMDGKFVPKDTREFMMKTSEILKQISNVPLDVHFMTETPKKYVDEYLPLNPNIITFQVEALSTEDEIFELIQYIKDNGCRVGVVIKPATPVSEILKYLNKIHMVLIMTVEPGLGRQGLIPETIDKVREVKEYLDENNLEVDIEVDGGVKVANVDLFKSAGANVLVAGTAIVNAENKEEAIEKLKE